MDTSHPWSAAQVGVQATHSPAQWPLKPMIMPFSLEVPTTPTPLTSSQGLHQCVHGLGSQETARLKGTFESFSAHLLPGQCDCQLTVTPRRSHLGELKAHSSCICLQILDSAPSRSAFLSFLPMGPNLAPLEPHRRTYGMHRDTRPRSSFRGCRKESGTETHEAEAVISGGRTAAWAFAEPWSIEGLCSTSLASFAYDEGLD